MNIEQRALDIITDNELLRKNTPQVRGAIRDALIQIATEQKAEDINKDCKVIERFCEGLQPHMMNFTIEDFRKAMEE